jgi:integrase
MQAGLHRPGDFVLATASGKPTMRRQAHRALQGVARRAKLIGKDETFRPHDLRAGFAVAALLAGDPPNLVQRLLGHRTSAMTMDLYGKLKTKEAVGTSAFDRPEADVVPIQAVAS